MILAVLLLGIYIGGAIGMACSCAVAVKEGGPDAPKPEEALLVTVGWPVVLYIALSDG